jgi:phosphotriesterase-related protein
MTEVQTATGAIPHDQLGVTLSHEHLFLASPGMRGAYPWLTDPETEIAHAVAQLEEAKAAGVRSIIEVSTPDLGRAPTMMQEASRRSGVHVVVASGIWLDIPRALQRAPIDDIAALFVHEIEDGLAEAECRAGVIKVANGDPPGIGDPQERILRAAARAASRTGVPVTTHTGPYTIGREQMRIFAEEGLPPHLVAIGHSFTDDLEYLREVLSAGHFLSVDHFGMGRDLEARVIEAVARLCADGHASRVMLGHDHAAESALSGYTPWWEGHPAHPSPSGYTYVFREVLPQLRKLGVPDTDIDAMLIAAPAAFLSGGRD